MRLPIGYALAYPDRLPTPFGAIDWQALSRLDFEPPDLDAFPCLALAYEAGRLGQTAPAWLSAANEVAVAAFLDGVVPWSAIAEVIAETLADWPGTKAEDVDVVLREDVRARRRAEQAVERRSQAA
jgi:1-deoxy-D-xylulose-5-phosphate reductoisomerase